MNEVERVPSPPKGVVSMDESADATSEGEISSAPPALSPVAQPWKKRKTIAIALVAGVVCLLAYWKFATLRFVFIALLPYAPVIIPSLVALGTICFKDWNNYKPKWVRWVLVLLVMVACCFGIGYQITQRTEKAAASILNQANIDGLKGQVAMAQKAQDDNTKRFLENLQALSDKISALQIRASTEALRAEIVTVKGELEKTQKALAPAPKAALALTFPGFFNPPPHPKAGEHFIPVTEMTLEATAEGNVKIPFRIVNPTEADALDGHLSIVVCDPCKFVKDPNGLGI